jgi:hypothetical protein
MSIQIKAKCDICNKEYDGQIKYVGQAPEGWYTLRYQAKSGRMGNLDICSDKCLNSYANRKEYIRQEKLFNKLGGK